MDTKVLQAVARYAEDIMGAEGFRYVSAVVANCKMLAVQLEGVEEQAVTLDMDALVVAAYLHDISTVSHGYQDHHRKSAEMAVEFLRECDVPAEQIVRVEQALLTHTTVTPAKQRGGAITEGQVLYDADKLGRLSGLAVVTSLIEFGARYPNQAVTGEVLAAILRHIEERFIELYQSLYTPPAREMAQEKFSRSLAFLDGLIEHLSDATPVEKRDRLSFCLFYTLWRRNLPILVVGSVALDTVETPFKKVDGVLGGAASYFSTAASLYDQVNLVAIVGSDFPQEYLTFWRERGVDLTGLQVQEGKTFHWSGRYHLDMNSRDTLDTQLGVFADFHPVVPDSYKLSPLVFLANIQPELQLEVLNQVPAPRLTVLDTMALWIDNARSQLIEVMKRVDVLLMSEEEVRQFTNQASILTAVRQLFALGLKYVVVKLGSYGALLFGADGTYFSAPSYPLEEVSDPTGAGDSFAGGFLGYLSTVQPQADGRYAVNDLKRAVVHGNIIGSFACADFGIGGLRNLTMEDISKRYHELVHYSHFEPDWRLLQHKQTV